MKNTWIRNVAGLAVVVMLMAGCGGEEENPNLATVQIEQLLVKPVPQQEARDKACSQAREVLEQIRGGADFAEMAASYSTHSSASDSGLITLTQGWMEPEFDQAVLAVKDSTLSDVVHTPVACYIIYRLYGTFLQVRTSHILCGVDSKKEGAALEAEFKRAEKEAWDVYNKLQAGGSFYDLAREKSDDPGSAQEGGDVGWTKRNQLVREYEAVAYAQEPGEISKPVRSAYGWHVIRTVQKKDMSMTVRLIQFKPPVTDADRRRARRALEQARRQADEGAGLAGLAQQLAGSPDGEFIYSEKFSVRKNVLRPDLAEQLGKMDTGDVSGVLENESGFYFVRLLEDE